jgi:hypothetical protein
MIRELGFTAGWVDAGVLDEASLLAAYAAYAQGDDRNAEHYRAGVFGKYLQAQASIPDEQLALLLDLTDGDGVDLGVDRCIQMIASGVLSDDQLQVVHTHPRGKHPTVAKRLRRELLHRRLSREALTDELFAEVCATGDAELERELLHSSGLTQKQAEQLRDSGANKAVRNAANQHLRSREKR